MSRKSIGASSDAPGSVSLGGERRGPKVASFDASSDTTSTMRIHQLLQKVKSTAEEMVERPEGLPESILKQFRPLWEKQLTAAKCKVLGDFLGFAPEFQKTIEPLLTKTLADAEDIARWESLNLPPETWQHLQSTYQEKKASIQWLEDYLAKMEGADGTTGHAKERFTAEQKDSTINKRLLSPLEESSILSYKSSESYKLNEALRDGGLLDQKQQKMVEGLDRALPKLPVYRGPVYRRMSFDLVGEKTYEAFLAEHQAGALVEYPAYTSASSLKDGYPVEGRLTVTIVIQSESGRNLDGYGNNFEKEIIFSRESRFFVERVEMDPNGKPIIYMREVTEDGAG